MTNGKVIPSSSAFRRTQEGNCQAFIKNSHENIEKLPQLREGGSMVVKEVPGDYRRIEMPDEDKQCQKKTLTELTADEIRSCDTFEPYDEEMEESR